jgi:hypothetical protein
MEQILKAEHVYFLPEPHPFQAAERVIVLHWRDDRGLPKFQGQFPARIARHHTPAYVSHGRWVADCPAPGCSSAQAVSPEDKRFWCVHCENAWVEGRWIRVQWPEDWQEREELLLRRPEIKTRNAFPHETVQGLREENMHRMGAE